MTPSPHPKDPMRTILLCATLAFCGGCATIVTGGGEDQAVRFASTPPGARVFVDNSDIGKTPMSFRLTRKDDHQVRMELAGYKNYEKEIKSGFNGWMFGDIILGGIIGLIVDLASGSNPALSPSNVSAKLVKDDSYNPGYYQPTYPSSYLPLK